MKTKVLCSALLLVVLLTGCTSITFRTATGTEIKATSFLNKRSISKASFDPATGKLTLQGYNNDQTELAAAVAGAIIAKAP